VTHWVLLRGWSREQAHWGDFPRRLQRQLPPGERVAALDLPGTGRLNALRSPAQVAQIAHALDESLCFATPQAPVMLVGLSMGGMVAVEWARANAARVAGCVLMNTSMRGLSPFWERLRPSAYGFLLGLARPGLGALTRERGVLALTSSDPARHLQWPTRWSEIARQRPLTRANVVRQLVAAARYRVPDDPPCPVLLLASNGDRLVNPSWARRIADAWQAALRLHPGAGHDLPLDAPDWVIAEMLAWRGRHASAIETT
jgi:pimeloyl-ACP methyl ester carboxylesterase